MTGWQVVLVMAMGGLWVGGFLTGRGTAPRPYPRDSGVTFDPGARTYRPGMGRDYLISELPERIPRRPPPDPGRVGDPGGGRLWNRRGKP